MTLRHMVVTGGTGFLGRQVVAALRASGLTVTSCSRAEGVDLRDEAAAGRWFQETRPDCVVHCAAHVGGIGYVGSHAIDVFHDNIAIASGLLKAMRQARIPRLVTVMPNCTYPGAKDLYRECEWWDGPVHDSVLMYGLPRKMLWGLCKTYGDVTGLRSAHLVLPNLYGPGDHFDPNRSHALGALVRKIVDAKLQCLDTVELWGTGRPVREWLYVTDAAAAVGRFLNLSATDGAVMEDHPIYNVGIGKGVTIAALAEAIRDATDYTGTFTFDTSRPDGAMQKLLHGVRFRELTGWAPTVPLQRGIEETVAWYQAHVGSELSHANP